MHLRPTLQIRSLNPAGTSVSKQRKRDPIRTFWTSVHGHCGPTLHLSCPIPACTTSISQFRPAYPRAHQVACGEVLQGSYHNGEPKSCLLLDPKQVDDVGHCVGLGSLLKCSDDRKRFPVGGWVMKGKQDCNPDHLTPATQIRKTPDEENSITHITPALLEDLLWPYRVLGDGVH